tara:strand:+ start:131 stop:367 length:237 start_codon:yes stop_codon:yes gene_type:complete
MKEIKLGVQSWDKIITGGRTCGKTVWGNLLPELKKDISPEEFNRLYMGEWKVEKHTKGIKSNYGCEKNTIPKHLRARV